MKKILSSLKVLIICFSSILIVQCSGNHQDELVKLDQIHGFCDNPQRNIRGVDYEICKAKERAAGPSGKSDQKEPVSITELLGGIVNKDQQLNGNFVSSQMSVNGALWQASLDVVSSYDIKTADIQSGFIQTEWIYDAQMPDLRCKIKFQITSAELISTGVQTTFICEENNQSLWASTKQSYDEEEKRLTLSVLQKAKEISENNL